MHSKAAHASPSRLKPLPGAGAPTDPIASEEGGNPWCRITRGVPTSRLLGVYEAIAQCQRSHRPHCLPRGGKSVVPDHTRGAHPAASGRIVDVPVSGTRCTVHRCNVGGRGRLQVVWSTCATFTAGFFAMGKPVYHANV